MSFVSILPKFIKTILEGSNPEHSAVLGAIKNQMDTMDSDLELFLKELSINTSTGIWLDEWGSWFGVYRDSLESDALYSQRIVDSLNEWKITIPAIKVIVAKYLTIQTGIEFFPENITIFEPYTQLKCFSSRGAFSGNMRYPNKDYWRRNVIDIRLPEGVEVNEEIYQAVKKVRSAGVKFWFSSFPSMEKLNVSDAVSDIILERSEAIDVSLISSPTLDRRFGSAYFSGIQIFRYLPEDNPLFIIWDELDNAEITYDELDNKNLYYSDFERGDWIQ